MQPLRRSGRDGGGRPTSGGFRTACPRRREQKEAERNRRGQGRDPQSVDACHQPCGLSDDGDGPERRSYGYALSSRGGAHESDCHDCRGDDPQSHRELLTNEEELEPCENHADAAGHRERGRHRSRTAPCSDLDAVRHGLPLFVLECATEQTRVVACAVHERHR